VGDNGEAAAAALSGDAAITNVVTIETAVTTAKILDGTILAADIAVTDAVTTAKIADANVTTARLPMLT
jgi:hypothetical protein